VLEKDAGDDEAMHYDSAKALEKSNSSPWYWMVALP
jgi:hypothetical protein